MRQNFRIAHESTTDSFWWPNWYVSGPSLYNSNFFSISSFSCSIIFINCNEKIEIPKVVYYVTKSGINWRREIGIFHKSSEIGPMWGCPVMCTKFQKFSSNRVVHMCRIDFCIKFWPKHSLTSASSQKKKSVEILHCLSSKIFLKITFPYMLQKMIAITFSVNFRI